MVGCLYGKCFLTFCLGSGEENTNHLYNIGSESLGQS